MTQRQNEEVVVRLCGGGLELERKDGGLDASCEEPQLLQEAKFYPEI